MGGLRATGRSEGLGGLPVDSAERSPLFNRGHSCNGLRVTGTRSILLVALLAVGCSDGDTGASIPAAGDVGAAGDTAGAVGDTAAQIEPPDVRRVDIADPDSDGPDGTDGSEDVGDAEAPPIVLDPPPPDSGIYGFAGGCYAVQAFDGVTPPRMLVATESGADFAFTDTELDGGARFRMRASDLGTYLLYDTERHYLIATPTRTGAEGPGAWRFERTDALESSLSLMDDAFKSPAEWHLEPSARDPLRYQLRQRQSERYLAMEGLTGDASAAAIITLFPREGCAEFPELTLDATGTVTPHAWEDGSVYGIAEIHSHMMTNLGFGGGSIFHGAPFHRLGVERALPSCEPFHGEEGRRDLVGLFYDRGADLDVDTLLPILTTGEAAAFNHVTDGFPEFVDWPNARKTSTHQTMYYRWLQRAYLSGLRLLVQHATGNSVLCDVIVGLGAQQVRYDCNDMVGVERTIAEMRQLQRYIDAQAGGPGKGWLRIVGSPAEARAAIGEGKLAVVLGIEISNLLDCFSTPKAGFDTCTPESVSAALDHFHDLGVRVIFPVHKYDNAFSAGDGSGGIIELGNFVNSGHYSSFVEDCPGPFETFDNGGVTFGGMNKPRDVYDAPPPVDTSGFADDLLGSMLPFFNEITAPPLAGNYCQKHGMTPLGETLMAQLMARGMIIDIAHLPQRAVGRAYELLEAADYPATKTHGVSTNGRIYPLGGLTGFGFDRCGDPTSPGKIVSKLTQRVAEIVAKGGYPAQALSFDLNGFAGSPGPRFGADAGCSKPQENPVTYPFTSYDGQITFQEPQLGVRKVDFNTEGMIHIGLLPELIEDVRRDGATDAQLEPLFRSAEAYLRMWEKAEARAAQL